MLTSDGVSADDQGDKMGLYQLMEKQYNNASAYKQLHNVTGTQGFFIYLADDGDWYIGSELGGRRGRGLRNTKSVQVAPINLADRICVFLRHLN